jgi:hypothetical protein
MKQKTIDQMLCESADLRLKVITLAVDSAWSSIESLSIFQLDGEIEWMDLGEDFQDCFEEVAILETLGLLEKHPVHTLWVREIASL